MSPEAPPPASQPWPEQVKRGRPGKQPGAHGPRNPRGRARAPGHCGPCPRGWRLGAHRGRGEREKGSLTTRSGSCPTPAPRRRGIRSTQAGPSRGGRARAPGGPGPWKLAGGGAGSSCGRRVCGVRGCSRVCGLRGRRCARWAGGGAAGPGPRQRGTAGAGQRRGGRPPGPWPGRGREGRAGGGRGSGNWRYEGAGPSRGRGMRRVRWRHPGFRNCCQMRGVGVGEMMGRELTPADQPGRRGRQPSSPSSRAAPCVWSPARPALTVGRAVLLSLLLLLCLALCPLPSWWPAAAPFHPSLCQFFRGRPCKPRLAGPLGSGLPEQLSRRRWAGLGTAGPGDGG